MHTFATRTSEHFQNASKVFPPEQIQNMFHDVFKFSGCSADIRFCLQEVFWLNVSPHVLQVFKNHYEREEHVTIRFY